MTIIHKVFALSVAIIFCINTRIIAGENVFQFMENKGQWPVEVLCKVKIPGGDLYILKNKLRYAFYPPPKDHKKECNHSEIQMRIRKDSTDYFHVYDISFKGANKSSGIQFGAQLSGTYNFFTGPDPSTWRSGLTAYKDITIKNVYKGIDLKLYTGEDGIKYDFIVRKEGNPENIRMVYEGQSGLYLRENKLFVHTIFGKIIEEIPVAYTLDSRNSRNNAEVVYKLNGNEVSFLFPDSYNTNETLIIDPALIFSTYSGSYADNWGYTATYDGQGNLYSGGTVDNPGFPVTPGVYQHEFTGGRWDVGILKYDSSGTDLIYATYLGGSFTETPQSLIVNKDGNLVIYGTTSSPDFPVTTNAYQKSFHGGKEIMPISSVPFDNGSDMFVSILSPDGRSLEASTFLGGTENDGIMDSVDLIKNYGDEFRGEVIFDHNNNIVIASNTTSPDFPIVNGFQPLFGGDIDGVVVKLSPDLSEIVWSTYLGGSDADAVYSLKTNKLDEVYVTGGSNSLDFPTTSGTLMPDKTTGDIDCVVTHIRADGSDILHSTFLGTSSYDQGYLLDLDTTGNVYVLGQSTGNYPVSAKVYSNPNSGQFIHKMDSSLKTTYFSTVVGSGSRNIDISPTAFLVNECGNIFLSGWGGVVNAVPYYQGGSTIGMPVTGNAFQPDTDGSDFYLMVLLKDAQQLLYGTYFGQSGGVGDHVDGGTSRFDKRGIVYHAVCGGCWGSSNFPTYPPDVWSTINNSTNCNNAAFKFDLASLNARFTTDAPDFTDPGRTSGCSPLEIMFLNRSIGGEDFLWNFGDNTISGKKDSVLHMFVNPGSYDVSLTATDINTCVRVSIAREEIVVHDQAFEIMPEDSICFGGRIQLWSSGGNKYHWYPSSTLNDPDIADPVAIPDSSTTYTVSIVNDKGCEYTDSVFIKVLPELIADFYVNKRYNCENTPELEFVNQSVNAGSFLWEFGDGTTSEEESPVYQYSISGQDLMTIPDTFTVRLMAVNSFCQEVKEQKITSMKPFVPNIISPNDDNKNDYFQVLTDEPVNLKIYNRWGKLVYENDSYDNSWKGDDVSNGVYYYVIRLPDNETDCVGWIHVLR